MSGGATFCDYAMAVALPIGIGLAVCLCRVALWLVEEDRDDSGPQA